VTKGESSMMEHSISSMKKQKKLKKDFIIHTVNNNPNKCQKLISKERKFSQPNEIEIIIKELPRKSRIKWKSKNQ
jgi:predicted nucleotide-binding protein (sugar kinase/HSP70/actin superfamily)